MEQVSKPWSELLSSKKPHSCKLCVHYVAADDEQGACRRYPPVMTERDGMLRTAFPIVAETFWCGEFK